MADLRALYDDGFRLAAEAAAKEEACDVGAARKLLIEAISQFMEATKIEPNNGARETVRANVVELIGRAEALAAVEAQREALKWEVAMKAHLAEAESGQLEAMERAAELLLGAIRDESVDVSKRVTFKQDLERLIERMEVAKGIEPILQPMSINDADIDRVDGGGNLSQNEIDVLRFTSVVAGHRYYPFVAKDAVFSPSTAVFEDPDGLLPLAPRQIEHGATFERPIDFMSKRNVRPSMVSMVSAQAVRQTIIGDCSFVSAMSVAANYERRFRKRLVTSIIFPTNRDRHPVVNPNGRYVVRLHLNGIPRTCVVDDRLPVDPFGNLLCSHSHVPGELWVSLIEKAFLKAMGGYNYPGSLGSVDMHILTGWIPEQEPLDAIESSLTSTDTTLSDRLWERIKSGHNIGDVLITCGTRPLSEQEAQRAGLVPSHAYAVLRVEQVEDKRLLQLKNPWSTTRFKGKYSESDTASWTPNLKKALDYDQNSSLNIDNGIFWVDFLTLAHFFHSIHLNWNPYVFQWRSAFHYKWPASQGPVRDRFNMSSNPQYLLTVNNKGKDAEAPIWVMLSRHQTKVKELEQDDFITMHVWKNGGRRIVSPSDPFMQGHYRNSPYYLVRLMSPRGSTDFTLVVSQYKKTADLYFTINVFSTVPFKFTPLPQPYVHEVTMRDAAWTATTAGGCINHRSTFLSNPQFRLILSERINVMVRLEASPDLQVGFMLYRATDLLTSIPSHDSMVGEMKAFQHAFAFQEFPDMEPGKYIIVPSTFLPGEQASFFLTASYSKGNKSALLLTRI